MMVSSRRTTLAKTLLLVVAAVGGKTARAQDTESDQVIGRLGLALSEGQAEARTDCTMLVNTESMGYTLNAVDLDKNCFLVPGVANEMYRLTMTTAQNVPMEFNFTMLEVANSGYTETPGTWDESSMGMEYCAPGGSIIYFDNMAQATDKKLEILTEWQPSMNTNDYCCVSQHIEWSWGHVRCPQYIEADDNSVCFSTPNYYLQADSLEYTVARETPAPSELVQWAQKDISNNCERVDVGIGGKYQTTPPNGPYTQTISADFVTSGSGVYRCFFIEFEQYAGNLDYFYVAGAGFCRGGDDGETPDLEFFSADQVALHGLVDECLELDKLEMSNTKGSSMVLTNVKLEVFKPWKSINGQCGRTQSPSSYPSASPSDEPSKVPSASPSDEPTTKPSTSVTPTTSSAPSSAPVMGGGTGGGDDVDVSVGTGGGGDDVSVGIGGDDSTGNNDSEGPLPMREPIMEPAPEPMGDDEDDETGDELDEMPVGKKAATMTDDVGEDSTGTGEEMMGKKAAASVEEEEEEEEIIPSREPVTEPETDTTARDPVVVTDENGNEIVYVLDADQSQSGGLQSEGVLGLICGMLLLLLLIVNCCFGYFYLFKRNDDGSRGRRRQRTRGSMPKEDPVGTVVTVEDLDGGKVMVKKVYPTSGGGNVVQKTVYPHQKAAARALKGYDYV